MEELLLEELEVFKVRQSIFFLVQLSGTVEFEIKLMYLRMCDNAAI